MQSFPLCCGIKKTVFRKQIPERKKQCPAVKKIVTHFRIVCNIFSLFFTGKQIFTPENKVNLIFNRSRLCFNCSRLWICSGMCPDMFRNGVRIYAGMLLDLCRNTSGFALDRAAVLLYNESVKLLSDDTVKKRRGNRVREYANV